MSHEREVGRDMKLSFSHWKQNNKYHYEIKEGNISTGRVIGSGSNYVNRKSAVKEMNKNLRRLARQSKLVNS